MKAPAILISLHKHTLDKYLVLHNSSPIILGRFYLKSPTADRTPAAHAEREHSIHEIAAMIGRMLDRYQPASWGMASAEDYADELVGHLELRHQRTMFKHLRINAGTINIGNVVDVFSCEFPFDLPVVQPAIEAPKQISA